MRFFLCNWLGPICTTYRFEDGTIVRRTSRESLVIERGSEVINVDFYYDRTGRYEYSLPRSLSLEKVRELTSVLDTYCRLKALPLVKHR